MPMAIAKDVYLMWWCRQAIYRGNTKSQHITDPLIRKMRGTKPDILRK